MSPNSTTSSDLLSDAFDFSPPPAQRHSSSWKSLLSLSPFSRPAKLAQEEVAEQEKEADTVTISSTTTDGEVDGEGPEEWEIRQRERIRRRQARKDRREEAKPSSAAVVREPEATTTVGRDGLARFKLDQAKNDLFDQHLRRIQSGESKLSDFEE